MHNTANGSISCFVPLPIRKIILRRGDRAQLESLLRSRTTAHRLLERAQIVLASAAGDAGNTICVQLGVSRPTVSRWLDRYDDEGLAGLVADRRRIGRPTQRPFRPTGSLSA